jgi:hypothetical protein
VRGKGDATPCSHRCVRLRLCKQAGHPHNHRWRIPCRRLSPLHRHRTIRPRPSSSSPAAAPAASASICTRSPPPHPPARSESVRRRCEEFAARGCAVYASARSTAKLAGLRASIGRLQLDVCHDESVRAAVDTVVRAEGRIDILVNNAGVQCVGPRAPCVVSRMRT